MPAEPSNPTAATASPLPGSLVDWVRYLRDLGIYDLYHRAAPKTVLSAEVRERLLAAAAAQPMAATGPSAAAAPGQATPRPATLRPATLRPTARPNSPPPRSAAAASAASPAAETASDWSASMPRPQPLDELVPPSDLLVPAAERAAALEAVRAEIGDCTRCPLAYAGRHKIVFADGDPNARLMFVGEGPGADEDATGTPFVGKAGQLLNNMIGAMGLSREQVYIANIVKCRPPANRTPEFAEATTCAPFLARQIDIVRPQVIVALGATAATYLLGVRQSLGSLRGQWHSARGAKVVVTYHPAFLLRDPRQKGEAWKDLQLVMAELRLTPPTRPKPTA